MNNFNMYNSVGYAPYYIPDNEPDYAVDVEGNPVVYNLPPIDVYGDIRRIQPEEPLIGYRESKRIPKDFTKDLNRAFRDNIRRYRRNLTDVRDAELRNLTGGGSFNNEESFIPGYSEEYPVRIGDAWTRPTGIYVDDRELYEDEDGETYTLYNDGGYLYADGGPKKKTSFFFNPDTNKYETMEVNDDDGYYGGSIPTVDIRPLRERYYEEPVDNTYVALPWGDVSGDFNNLYNKNMDYYNNVVKPRYKNIYENLDFDDYMFSPSYAESVHGVPNGITAKYEKEFRNLAEDINNNVYNGLQVISAITKRYADNYPGGGKNYHGTYLDVPYKPMSIDLFFDPRIFGNTHRQTNHDLDYMYLPVTVGQMKGKRLK